MESPLIAHDIDNTQIIVPAHEATPELVRKSDAWHIAFYERSIASQTLGPQLEGFTPHDVVRVFNDPETVKVKLVREEGEYDWPLLTPVKNFSEYLPSYFADRYGSDVDCMYLSLPPETHDLSEEVVAELKKLSDTDKTLIVDQLGASDKLDKFGEQLGEYGIQVQVDELIDPKNNTPATVFHFEGLTEVVPDEVPVDSSDLREVYQGMEAELSGEGTQLVDVSRVDEPLETGVSMRDRLWQIYQQQFGQLIENHPARQAQYEYEFDAMLRDPETLTIAHLVDGDVVSFATFVGNIESCDWLNTDFYRQNFPDEKVLYFPGIATDAEKQGNHYAMNLIDLVAKLCVRAKVQPRIVFQCTNISADYIPHIVKGAVEATGLAKIEINEMARYDYRAIRLTSVA